MSTTLISFLGRTRKDDNGYDKTRYEFNDKTLSTPVAFFGWALIERLRPRRMIILGTSGSMWDYLFEGDINLGSDGSEDLIALMESTDAKKVTQGQLDRLAPLLGSHLHCEVKLILIPYCRNEAEQIELLRLMAEHVTAGEEVDLDITHGFRHLPMLALLAALHLRIARQAKIKGIWYGSYDPDTKRAPVLDLSGLLHIADGLQALASFDNNGDYSVFIPLLQKGGLSKPALDALHKAAYYENILNVGAATGQLRRARDELDNPRLSLDAQLLLPPIRERLDWLNENRQFEKQTKLARRALDRRDYLRATLYAYEAVITRLCQANRVPVEDFEQREQVRKQYEGELKAKQGQERENYNLLKNLRNQVAHGTRGSVGDVQRALLDETVMRQTLNRLLDTIEKGDLPTS